MTPAETTTQRTQASDLAAGPLDDLIPVAVAVAAGCERCTERAIHRALERGNPHPAVARTLAIVSHIRGRDCFADAVGPQVIARMEGPLRTGEKTLDAAKPAAAEPRCCG
jgi:hypothetical protein